MAKLTDYRLLAFDVYGTLVDWESGIITALQPYLSRHNESHAFTRLQLLELFNTLSTVQQTKTPDMRYSQLIATVLPQMADHLGLATGPTADECTAFGNSIGQWPAFPDSVEALRRLGKHFKLVVLSNTDRDSFSVTNAGPLAGVHFDAVITAQDIGSYKPDRRNFDFMLHQAETKFGIAKAQVLQTAQSQFHDHQPARAMGIRSVWIARPGADIGNVKPEDEKWDWRFDTLGDMADALDQEVAGDR